MSKIGRLGATIIGSLTVKGGEMAGSSLDHGKSWSLTLGQGVPLEYQHLGHHNYNGPMLLGSRSHVLAGLEVADVWLFLL